MRLDLGGDLAAAMLVRNRGGCVVSCGLELVRPAGLDLVAQRRSLAIGDGGMTGRGRTALLRPGFDGHVREARLRQIAADQCHVVVAMRRARHEAWWIIWKKL